MKKISNICGFIGIAIYAVLMIRISNLCQYGGTKVDLIPILIFGVVLIATIIFGIVSSRKEEKIEKGKLFWGKCIVVVALTILFGGRIIYSAIPYNGALSWKIDEWRNQKKIELTHTNFFETGVEGILEDIETELDLPDELYVQNKFQLSFDKDGEIQSIYTYMYGRYENGDENTFLIDYDVDADSKMTVCINGVASKSYDDDMRLQPMLEILKNADYKTRVNNWAVEGYADDYEILYYGKREFNTMEGFVYLQGDVDGDGVDNTDNAIYSELNGGAVYGYEVSLHIPWSFVMNDELWNLMPMDSSLNSAKSNRLPKWNPFFEVFAGNQYLMYEMINERPDLHKRFEACYRDNLHSIWAGQELYRKGNSREVFYNILERNMMPVYDSARRQGYEIWNYG